MDLMQSGAPFRRSSLPAAVSAGFLLFYSAHLSAASETLIRAGSITQSELVQQQELPSLAGEVAEPALSRVPDTLTIEQAVQRAVQWHPDIAQAIGTMLEQANQVDVAKAKYYPQISAGMNNGYSNSYSGSGFSPSFVLSVSQMLYDFGKVSSSVRSAEAGVAQEQANVLVSIDSVAHDTAAALVQVQGYQQLVKIARDQLSALSRIGVLARQRNEEGAASLSDATQTDARIEGARTTLTQYQASLNRWRATLATYLGWPLVKQVSDQFPATLTRGCASGKADDKTNPAVLAAWAQANQAQAKLDNASAQNLPTISLEPQVTHYLNDRYAGSQSLDRTQYSAFVKVEMPLYQGGGITAARDAAASALQAANAAVNSARLKARQQLSESQNEALSLSQSLAVMGRQQALGEKTRQLYQDQYLQLGTRPLLDVLNAEQEVWQTRFTLQQTVSQLRSLQLDCLYSTGQIRSAFTLNNQRIQTVEIQP
ncbi:MULTISPECIES: TolC family outer membrane protein [Pantoea]|uniref:TolC family outer membrane protein n=1 Tax=Pantoea TaxID=53335 RepID=UPI002594D44A|nr:MULTISPECIES: TolC family outer membrane protein [Pantoea]